MGTETQKSYCFPNPLSLIIRGSEVQEIQKSEEEELKRKIPKAAVCTRKEDSILQMLKKPQGKLQNYSLILLLERIKTSASFIKLYFQNCITGSPETLDVGQATSGKQVQFRSSQIMYIQPSWTGVWNCSLCPPNNCKLNNSM